MSGSVERWLKTFMCDKYAALFEAYGFKTLHSVCQLQPSTLHSMGIPPEHCDEILENISLIRQSIDASSPEHVVPQDAGLAYGLRHNLQSPHYTGSSYSDHGYDHQMAGHPQSNNYSYQSAGSYPSHQHYGTPAGQMNHSMPYPVSEPYPGSQPHYGPSNHDVYGPHMYNNHVHPAHGGAGGGGAWDDPAMRLYNHSPRHIMGSSPPPPPPSSLMRSPPPSSSSSPAGVSLPHYPRHSIMDQPSHPLPHHHPWAQGQGVSPAMMNSPRATPSPSVGHPQSSNASPAMSNCSPAHGKPFSPQPYSPHAPSSHQPSAAGVYDYAPAPGHPQLPLPPPISVPARHPGSPSVAGVVGGSPSDPLMSLQKMVMLDQQNIRTVHGGGHSPLGLGAPPLAMVGAGAVPPLHRPGPKFSSVEQLAGCGTPSPCPSHVSKSNDAPSPSLASVESTCKSSCSTTGGVTPPPLPLPAAVPRATPSADAVASSASDGSNGPSDGNGAHAIVTDDEGTTLLNIGTLCNGTSSARSDEAAAGESLLRSAKTEPNGSPTNCRKRRLAPATSDDSIGVGQGYRDDYYDGESDGASLLEIGCCKSELAVDSGVKVAAKTTGKAGRRKKMRAAAAAAAAVPENGHSIVNSDMFGGHSSPRQLVPVLSNGPASNDAGHNARIGHANFTFPLDAGVDRKPEVVAPCDEKTLTLLSSPRRSNNNVGTGGRRQTKMASERGRASPHEHHQQQQQQHYQRGPCGSPSALGCDSTNGGSDPAESWNLRVSTDMKFVAKKMVGGHGHHHDVRGGGGSGVDVCATANTWTPPLPPMDCDVKPSMMLLGGGGNGTSLCKQSPRLCGERPDTNGRQQQPRFKTMASEETAPPQPQLNSNNNGDSSRPGEDDETIGSHWTESLRAHLTDTGDEESVASSDQQLWGGGGGGSSLGHFGGGIATAAPTPPAAPVAVSAPCGRRPRASQAGGGTTPPANPGDSPQAYQRKRGRPLGSKNKPRPPGFEREPPVKKSSPKKGAAAVAASLAASPLVVAAATVAVPVAATQITSTTTTPTATTTTNNLDQIAVASAVEGGIHPAALAATPVKPPKLTVRATEMPPPNVPAVSTSGRRRATMAQVPSLSLVSEGTQTRKVIDAKPKGPYVHLGGASDKFLEVILSNSASSAAVKEEDSEAKGGAVKRRSFPAHGGGVGKRKMNSVGFNSTLSANYDVFTRDKSWVCALCRAGSHYKGLGDLFGPYFEDSVGHAHGVVSGSSSFGAGAGGDRKSLLSLTAAVGTGVEFEPAPGCSSSSAAAAAAGEMSATRKVRARRKRSELVEEFFKTTMAKKGKKLRESVRSSAGCAPSFSPEPASREPVAGTSTATATTSSSSCIPAAPATGLATVGCGELWAHEDCIVWSHGVYLLGNKIVGLKDAVAHAAEMVCSCCNQFGATIGCLRKGCVEKFHYICAIEKGCQLVEEHLSVLCPKHKKKVNTDS